MKTRVLSRVILLTVFITICLTACDQGIEERIIMDQEPMINVITGDGDRQSMKLEQYIKGVVAGEMKRGWPESAYGAQSILARTFALQYLEDNNTDTISGSFELAQEYKPDAITADINRAVENTRGVVVLHEEEYIKSWFHASAGGYTTSARIGLAYEGDEPPYIKMVKSPDQKAPSDVREWNVYFANTELKTALEKMGKDAGEIDEIKIMDRDRSGRIDELEFSGTAGTVRVKAANFRKELDSQRLKSIKISDIAQQGNGYIFSGSGFGHGVGLSQWGAYSLALDNKSAAEIIEYYFKNVELVKIFN